MFNWSNSIISVTYLTQNWLSYCVLVGKSTSLNDTIALELMLNHFLFLTDKIRFGASVLSYILLSFHLFTAIMPTLSIDDVTTENAATINRPWLTWVTARLL